MDEPNKEWKIELIQGENTSLTQFIAHLNILKYNRNLRALVKDVVKTTRHGKPFLDVSLHHTAAFNGRPLVSEVADFYDQNLTYFDTLHGGLLNHCVCMSDVVENEHRVMIYSVRLSTAATLLRHGYSMGIDFVENPTYVEDPKVFPDRDYKAIARIWVDLGPMIVGD